MCDFEMLGSDVVRQALPVRQEREKFWLLFRIRVDLTMTEVTFSRSSISAKGSAPNRAELGKYKFYRLHYAVATVISPHAS